LFLALALAGGKWLTSRPGRFILKKETQYILDWRLGGIWNYSGGLEREKYPLPIALNNNWKEFGEKWSWPNKGVYKSPDAM
jgi:hypothetical protein